MGDLPNMCKGDFSLPDMGLGALHFGVYLTAVESNNLIHQALDHGVNFIDTGPLYGSGNSESIVGRSVAKQRDKFLISSKVGLKKLPRADGSFGVEVAGLTPEFIRESLLKSLTELGTDYIDVYQIHAFDASVPIGETFGELQRLVDEGKIRAFGASNLSPSELEKILNELDDAQTKSFKLIESHYNILERKVESGVLQLAKNNQISLSPYRALGRGLLTGKYNGAESIPVESRAADSWRVRNCLTEVNLEMVDLLMEIARIMSISIVELSLRWLIDRDGVGPVLVGARNNSQLTKCLGALSVRLTENDYQNIDQALLRKEFRETVLNTPSVYFEK